MTNDKIDVEEGSALEKLLSSGKIDREQLGEPPLKNSRDALLDRPRINLSGSKKDDMNLKPIREAADTLNETSLKTAKAAKPAAQRLNQISANIRRTFTDNDNG